MPEHSHSATFEVFIPHGRELFIPLENQSFSEVLDLDFLPNWQFGYDPIGAFLTSPIYDISQYASFYLEQNLIFDPLIEARPGLAFTGREQYTWRPSLELSIPSSDRTLEEVFEEESLDDIEEAKSLLSAHKSDWTHPIRVVDSTFVFKQCPKLEEWRGSSHCQFGVKRFSETMKVFFDIEALNERPDLFETCLGRFSPDFLVNQLKAYRAQYYNESYRQKKKKKR